MREVDRQELERLFPALEVIETPRIEEDKAGWLQARRQGIGGSDVAKIMGLSPWGSAHSVWADKLGLFEPDEDPPSLAAEIGSELEPLIIRKWEQATQLEALLTPGLMLRNPERPWQTANVDAVGYNPQIQEVAGVVEGKSTSNPDHWKTGVPLYYQGQGQQYADILGAPRIWYPVVAFNFYGPDFKLEELEPDAEDQELIRNVTRRFWLEYVETATPPPISGTEGARDALARYFGPDNGRRIDLEGEAVEIVDRFAEVKEQIAELQEQRDALEARLLEHIGENKGGVTPDGRKVTAIRKRAFDAKAFKAENPELHKAYSETLVRFDKKAFKKSAPQLYDVYRDVKSVYIRIFG